MLCHVLCIQRRISGGSGKDQFGQNRMLMGLQPEQFSYPLNTGEVFVIPETVMTYSRNGLAELSQNLHRCFRNNLCRGPHKEKVRPILINSWEASYFDFDGESILKLAEEAKSWESRCWC